MPWLTLYMITVIGATGISVWLGYRLFSHYASTEMDFRVVASTVPLSMMITLFIGFYSILGTPLESPWHAARIIPPFALYYDYPLYPIDNSGPLHQGTLYGPIPAFLWLPAVLFRKPSFSIFYVNVTNLLFILVPMYIVSIVGRSRKTDHGAWIIGIASATTSLYIFYTTASWVGCTAFTNLLLLNTVDPPALGLTAMACIAVFRGVSSNRESKRTFNIWYIASILLINAAIWTKLTVAPVIVALILYVLLIKSWKEAYIYTVLFILAFASLAGFFIYIHGYDSLWHNMISIGASHTHTKTLKEGILHFWYNTRPIIVILSIYLCIRTLYIGKSYTTKEIIQKNDWLLFVLVALFAVPASVKAYLVPGGVVNHALGLFYFLSLAFARAISGSASEDEKNIVMRSMSRSGLIIGTVAMIVTYTFFLFDPNRRVAELYQSFHLSHDQAAEYARKNPGTIWFPWNPLSNTIAERRVYHFAYSIYDRILAGHDVRREDIQAYIPEKLKYIAFYQNIGYTQAQYEHIMTYFPRYTEIVEIPELENWTVYTSR